MANKNKKRRQQQTTFYKVLGIIADIIMYPVMIVSLFSACFMLINNRNSTLPSFFGISAVKVLSGSMLDGGFKVGDVVFVKEVDPSTLKVGDIIAFYKQFDTCDRYEAENFVSLEEYQTDYNGTSLGQTIEGRTDVSTLQKRRASVYFHRIVDIKVLPKDGSLFFETKGDSVTNVDGYIRQDFLIGRYINTPRIVRDTMAFCSSQTGMICLVVVPLSLLVLLECLSIIEQINNMILENRVFYGEEAFDSKESIKANIGRDMDLYRQVYFYAMCKDDVRQKVRDFLWGNCFDEYSTKKEIDLRQKIEESEQYLGDKRKYFDFWANNLQSNYQKRKFDKLLEQSSVLIALSSEKTNQNDKNVQKGDSPKLDSNLNATNLPKNDANTTATELSKISANPTVSKLSKVETNQTATKPLAADDGQAKILPQKPVLPARPKKDDKNSNK